MKLREASSVRANEWPAGDADYGGHLRQLRRSRWQSFSVILTTTTPMLGGGVESGRPDVLVPVRPRAIKNAVSHWWWLRHRIGWRDRPQELWAEHAATFGAASGASPEAETSALRVSRVQTDASSLKFGYCLPCRVGNSGKLQQETEGPLSVLGYALFSARGTLAEAAHQSPQHCSRIVQWMNSRAAHLLLPPDGRQGLHPLLLPETEKALRGLFTKEGKYDPPKCLVTAGLKVRIEFEIDASLQAAHPLRYARLLHAIKMFLVFGGLGARTSKGLGSFDVQSSEGLPFDLPDSDGRMAALLSGDDGQPMPGWSFIATRNSLPSASDAWLDAVADYRSFRQARPPRIRGQQPRPGRSYLPDADVVRSLTARVGHPVVHPAALSGHHWLTKLTLGAPVVMHFTGQGEPGDATLNFCSPEGVELNRFPSPVRIRPLVIRGAGGGPRYLSSFLRAPFLSDTRDKCAKVTWTGGSRVIPANGWQPEPKSTQTTSPQVEALFGHGAMQALYGPRSQADAAAMAIEASSTGAWSVVQMLEQYFLNIDQRQRYRRVPPGP